MGGVRLQLQYELVVRDRRRERVGVRLVALLLGVVESLGASFISSPYQNVYGFVLVLLILLVRPYGLFGERGREA